MMFLQKLQEELIHEKIHDYYKNQNFFKALKKYPNETEKIMFDFFKKKGIRKFNVRDYSSQKIDFDEYRKDFTKEQSDIFKSYGFKDDEIKKFKVGTLSFDDIRPKTIDAFKYTVKLNNPIDLKNHLDSLDSDKRNKSINSIVSSLKELNTSLHKQVETEIQSEIFSAEKSNRGLALPKFEKDGFILKISASSNDQFFEEGHDLKIKVKKDHDEKEYSFKINFLRPIETVLEDVWKSLEKSIQMYQEGVDQGTETEKSSDTTRKKITLADPVRIIRNYFSKWYSITKTGKLREVSSDRMPVEIRITGPASSTSTRSHNINQKRDQFTISLKFKGSKATYHAVKEKHPDIMKWNDIYREAAKGIKYVSREPSDVIGKKLFDDDIHKFKSRLDFVMNKLAAEGWLAVTFRGAYKRGDYDEITLKYSEQLKKKFQDDSSDAKEKYGSKSIKVATDLFDSKGTSINEVPRLYIRKIFQLVK